MHNFAIYYPICRRYIKHKLDLRLIWASPYFLEKLIRSHACTFMMVFIGNRPYSQLSLGVGMDLQCLELGQGLNNNHIVTCNWVKRVGNAGRLTTHLSILRNCESVMLWTHSDAVAPVTGRGDTTAALLIVFVFYPSVIRKDVTHLDSW